MSMQYKLNNDGEQQVKPKMDVLNWMLTDILKVMINLVFNVKIPY